VEVDFSSIFERFESIKRTSPAGVEYWRARELQEVLGYSRWESFENVIERARQSCDSTGVNSERYFRQATKIARVGMAGGEREVSDFFLARFACYLIAMNGGAAKPEIAAAQRYFAVQTRRMEIQDQISGPERRLLLRERVTKGIKNLNSAAKDAGVSTAPEFARFHAAGYRGLYGLSLKQIKRIKGLPKNDDLLDRAGHAELAANEFRITQTEQKIRREKVKGAQAATYTHQSVGREVRDTIARIGGTMPELLAPEPSIKKLSAARRRELAATTKAPDSLDG
jgi:DNA-damage-inducible protein D